MREVNPLLTWGWFKQQLDQTGLKDTDILVSIDWSQSAFAQEEFHVNPSPSVNRYSRPNKDGTYVEID